MLSNSGQCLRIEVPLNLADPRANVFSFPRLVAKLKAANEKPKKDKGKEDESSTSDAIPNAENTENEAASPDDSEDNSEDSDDSETEDLPDGGAPKKRTRTDPTNVYDIEDTFIDDSDMLDGSGAASNSFNSNWSFGYFAWRGKVENFHEDVAFQDFFEAPRAPAAKKKRGVPAGQAKTTGVKKSADSSPVKLADSATAKDSLAPNSTQTVTAEKKRKRAPTGTPAKAKAAASNGDNPGTTSGVDGALDSGAPTPAKKKKRVSFPAIPQLALPTAAGSAAPAPHNTNANENDEEDKKARKKVPLPPALEVAVNYLKSEREKESFENKKNFPQNLRPPLLEASKIAVLSDQMNENFIKHMKKVLPYNSFTLKRLIGRMLLQHAVMQSNIQLTIKTTAFQNLIKSLCAQQGIDGPQVPPPEPPAPAAAAGPPDSISTLVAVTEKKKFRFDEESKLALWNLLVLEWEQAEIHNLLNSMDSVNTSGVPSVKFTDANVRKTVYAKLLAFWPSGWMSTVELSREYSLYKRRINTRATSSSVALDPAVIGNMYIDSVANMLAPDTREVFRILKAMKALLIVPTVKEEGGGTGGEKKESTSGVTSGEKREEGAAVANVPAGGDILVSQ